jgi:hypothetical protein
MRSLDFSIDLILPAALSLHLPGNTEESHEKSPVRISGVLAKIRKSISRIRVYSVTATPLLSVFVVYLTTFPIVWIMQRRIINWKEFRTELRKTKKNVIKNN